MSTIEKWETISRYEAEDFTDRVLTTDTWSEEAFLVIVNKYKLKARPTLAEATIHARAFLNKYVGGQETGLSDNIRCLLHYIKKDDKFLLEDNYNGNVEINNAGTVAERTTFERDTTQIISTSGEGPSHTGTEMGGSPQLMSVDDCKQWYATLWKALQETPEVAITYLGYLALICLRLGVKESNSVGMHIKRKFHENYYHFWKLSPLKLTKVPGPSQTFIALAKAEIEKGSSGLTAILADMVYSYGLTGTPDDHKGILMSACLLSFRKLGMSTLHWLQAASDKTGCKVVTLMKYMATQRYASTNDALIEVITKYMMVPTEKSWPWARLFMGNAFIKLSGTVDKEYAAIMMSIAVGGDRDSPMWDIMQFSSISNTDKTAIIETARKISFKIAELDRTRGFTQEAQSLNSVVLPAETDPLLQI